MRSSLPSLSSIRRFGPRVFLWMVVSCSIAACALAQVEVEGNIGTYDPGSAVRGADFNNGSMFGFRVGQSSKFIGGEFSYTFMNDVQEKAKGFQGKAHLINSNVLVHVPLGRFVPYGGPGIGSIVGTTGQNLKMPTKFTWNFGGGVKLRYLAGRLGLRFDVRYYKTPDGVEIPISLVPLQIDKTAFTLAVATWGVLFSF
jgi:hypothetical protein